MNKEKLDGFLAELEEKSRALGEKIAALFKKKEKKKNAEEATVNSVPTDEEKRRNDELLASFALEADRLYKERFVVEAEDYDKTVPQTKGLEKKTYVPRATEDMEAEAENSVKAEYDLKKADAERKYEEDKAALDTTSDELELSRASAEYEALKSLGDELSEHESRMVRQGLVNSSIREKGAEEVIDEGKRREAELDARYDLKLRKIEDDKKSLELDYESALKSYELKRAAAIEKNVLALKAAEEKRKREIENYNKSVDKAEAAYQKERTAIIKEKEAERLKKQEELFAEYEREKAANGGKTTPKDALIQNERYLTALEFYKTLDKNVATALIVNAESALKEYVGEDNYFNLLLRVRLGS